MRYPRASNIDLNFDGIQDLLLFENRDNSVMPFIGNGDKKNPKFTYDPRYVEFFPELDNWVLLVDYNCDDLPDIFTSSGIGGVSVYENVSSGKTLKFKLAEFELEYYDTDLEFDIPVYCNSTDVPVVDDIDGDGDIDFLSFDSGGGDVQFYANQSQDRHNNCDKLEFLVETYCWGMFQEGETSNDITHLATCLLDPANKTGKHSGSNMLVLDIDDDGDLDLALSDISYRDVVLLENGKVRKGKADWRKDTMLTATENFPAGTKAIDVDIFPAMFYVDTDFDGIKDLYVAPGPSSDEGYTVTQSWLYKNNGKNTLPDFDFVQDNFLQGEGIDQGVHAYPAFFDKDLDGDLDLIVSAPEPTGVGHEGYFQLVLYENVGNAKKPVFKRTKDNYLDLFSGKHTHLSPAFGDLDNDGDDDLILGKRNGEFIYFENTAASGKEASFTLDANTFKDVKTTEYPNPCVYDMDGDSKADLLIGTDSGYVEFWKGNGSTFSLDNPQLGGVYVGQTVPPNFKVPGYASISVADVDNDGKPEMVVGNTYGNLFFYDDISTTQNEFKLVTNKFYNELKDDTLNKDFGKDISITLADLNGDTLADLFVGTIRGGVNYFQGGKFGSINIPKIVFEKALDVFPNPSNSLVNLVVKDPAFDKAQVRIINSTGQEISHFRMSEERKVLDVGSWPKGIYYITLQNKGGALGAKPLMVR